MQKLWFVKNGSVTFALVEDEKEAGNEYQNNSDLHAYPKMGMQAVDSVF